MKLEQVIRDLQEKLRNPLPGRGGQMTMAPEPVDESRFSGPLDKSVRKGAVLILLYPENGQCLVPFIKRPTYAGVHSGQVAFPGGKWEEEDQGLQETALRETEEEIGVERSKVELIGNLSDLYIPPSNFLVSPYIGFIEQRPKFRPDPREVSRIIHCDFETLVDQNIRKRKTLQLSSGYQVQAPYFDINEEVVWGATAMILGELMTIWER